MQVGMFDAKTNLSKLVALAQQGEEILITNRGEVVARLVGTGSRKQASAKELLDEMRALNKENPLGTLNELMEWKSEGRK
ncbi:MAG: type II toxin-antitoxin system prevent-host-death family antitoxin [Rickettsiales bacterium]